MFVTNRQHGVVHRSHQPVKRVEREQRRHRRGLTRLRVLTQSPHPNPGHLQELPRVLDLFPQRLGPALQPSLALGFTLGILGAGVRVVHARDSRGDLPPRLARGAQGGDRAYIRRRRRRYVPLWIEVGGCGPRPALTLPDAIRRACIRQRPRRRVRRQQEGLMRAHGVPPELVHRAPFLAVSHARERVPSVGVGSAASGAEDVGASTPRASTRHQRPFLVPRERWEGRLIVLDPPPALRAAHRGHEVAARGCTAREREVMRRAEAHGREAVRARRERRSVGHRLHRRDGALGHEHRALLDLLRRHQRSAAGLHEAALDRVGVGPQIDKRCCVGGGGIRARVRRYLVLSLARALRRHLRTLDTTTRMYRTSNSSGHAWFVGMRTTMRFHRVN